MSADALLWIDQATADLQAAESEHEGIRECHRRYWLQQAYEKGIKAYGIALWNPAGATPEEQQQWGKFCFAHSPLSQLDEFTLPPKKIWALRRQIDAELNTKVGDKLDQLRKIDDTKPAKSPDEVSYRYPFRDGGTWVIPAEWDGWARYQGDEAASRKAVRTLIASVRKMVTRSGRKPA